MERDREGEGREGRRERDPMGRSYAQPTLSDKTPNEDVEYLPSTLQVVGQGCPRGHRKQCRLLSLLWFVQQQEDPIAEDTVDFGHRTWEKVSWYQPGY